MERQQMMRGTVVLHFWIESERRGLYFICCTQGTVIAVVRLLIWCSNSCKQQNVMVLSVPSLYLHILT